jgi:hypothetical protein
MKLYVQNRVIGGNNNQANDMARSQIHWLDPICEKNRVSKQKACELLLQDRYRRHQPKSVSIFFLQNHWLSECFTGKDRLFDLDIYATRGGNLRSVQAGRETWIIFIIVKCNIHLSL